MPFSPWKGQGCGVMQTTLRSQLCHSKAWSAAATSPRSLLEMQTRSQARFPESEPVFLHDPQETGIPITVQAALKQTSYHSRSIIKWGDATFSVGLSGSDEMWHLKCLALKVLDNNCFFFS